MIIAQKNELFNKIYKYEKIYKILFLLILCILPIFTSKLYTLGILTKIFIYGVLAGSLNVINGYSGQTSIGHAGFFCIGAYCEAILSTKFGINFWILIPIAGLFTAFVGVLISLPTLKLKGIYLSIVTLGFSEIVRLIALNWVGLTGGSMGIKGIPAPTLFGHTIRGKGFYYLFLGILLIFLFVTNRVINSKFGRAWISIREDEMAAKSLGVESSKYKAMNFAYGAFWAGVIGSAYAPYVKFIDSTFFSLDEGFNILSMVIIGGQGTLAGPILGSVVVNLLTEILRPFGQWRLVAYACLIIIMMWFRPQGLMGASDSILANKKIEMKKNK